MMNNLHNIINKNILLLQGPMGPFFKNLDKVLRKNGAITYKIGFNVGDWLFSYKDNYVAYKDTLEAWPKFIEDFLLNRKIDIVFMFGDCRFYQKHAREIAYKYGVEIYVFEEGYVRPNYITIEKCGVNGFSTISKESDFYRNISVQSIPSPKHVNYSKTKMIFSAIVYYTSSNLFNFLYPNYKHHRGFSALTEAYNGLRGLWRKIIFKVTERKYQKLISNELSNKYYFVPLQTHNDFQIKTHSRFNSIEEFIIELLDSFFMHAPKDKFLIFKHHPVDRGRKNYHKFIVKEALKRGIKERVLVFHDVHLPTCLKNAEGTLTINSTVGLSSIAYGVPTLALGSAIYDIKGLTNYGVLLDDFWHTLEKPDYELYKSFNYYVIKTTQLNGSFYGNFPQEFENLGVVEISKQIKNTDIKGREICTRQYLY